MVDRKLPRMYTRALLDHLNEHRQMAFVAGPRQVGKTTVCRALASEGGYLNWDDLDHRRIVLAGPKAVANHVGLDRLGRERPTVVFDELHRYGKWKQLLKGFFDTYETRVRIVVTGSSRLDVYRRGGDSLMGRYFLYHIHPLSVGELVDPEPPTSEIRPPRRLPERRFENLCVHGGYPEPLVRADPRFTRRWRALRLQQLVREDVRDLTRIQELALLEILAHILAERSGSQLSFTHLAQELKTSVDTVRRWIELLIRLHHGFVVRPWSKAIARSLRKEPKWYVSDWGSVEDPGARAETMIAAHLLKSVQAWNDLGLGRFELYYLRDKQKREVDFLVVRDRKPWFMVEAKRSDPDLSPHLDYFQRQTGALHAFQAVTDLPYVDADCFSRKDPCVVPARTLLSQLI